MIKQIKEGHKITLYGRVYIIKRIHDRTAIECSVIDADGTYRGETYITESILRNGKEMK